MTNSMAVFLALLFSLIGSPLLYDGVSGSAANQTAEIVGGATFLALALTTLWVVLKIWWEWRKIRSAYHRVQELWH